MDSNSGNPSFPALPAPRRFVTQHNEDGVATIAAHPDPEARTFGDGSYAFPLWSASEAPADVSNSGLGQAADIHTASMGSFFTAYDIPPNYDGPFHRSITLDYVLVFKGTIVLTTEDGTRTTLGEGDTIVQRGTMHKWSNEGTDWARMVTVMVPALPVITGGQELSAHWPYEDGPGKQVRG
ncbi:hypothetical protein LCI18_000469 [Fusarium solani-melongenae]|uniref:Uncharacterized protein n=1 Tax=Fusarium solani subsp. cucurbitae TaxID=2747967 RepID=A0ACD3YKQ3_FUSSC|nr:hypothetical protein LCI18_000469 [Fusarium solani-melongenae]